MQILEKLGPEGDIIGLSLLSPWRAIPMSLHEQATQPTPEYREIPLTQGQVAIVSPEDYGTLSVFNWCASRQKGGRTFYALRAVRTEPGKRGTVLMHREIMKAPDGTDDHFQSSIGMPTGTRVQIPFMRGVMSGCQEESAPGSICTSR